MMAISFGEIIVNCWAHAIDRSRSDSEYILRYLYIYVYRVYKKKVDKSEIALCFTKRLNIRCFFIKIDCFGTYNLE